ncbi:MAG: isoleucine--tRNA ligase, partial [Patescibacteria group bacterium]
EGVLDFWDKAKIFEKSMSKEAKLGNFVFFEGPPTANGIPGIHHVLARSFKDVMPRYKTMKGYSVQRKAGWDTHGLPVELQVEKELNISGKPDIEKYGILEFNQKCRESVWKFKDEWERLTKRTAYWVDLNNPYITYENYYIESLWWIISQVHEKGLLYKGHKVVPHCPRCGTALSTHEVAQGYKKVQENSVFLNFKVTEGNGFVEAGDIMLAWTTTPWTLPGNVALAVGENIEYVKVKYDNQKYILAAKRVADVFAGLEYEILEKMDGEDLVGLKYQPLFEIEAIKNSGQKVYVVVPGSFVTTEDGSGIVHTAVMYGDEDYMLGEKEGLPKVHTVDEAGHFNDSVSAYGLAGKFVKSQGTEKIIIEYLKTSGLLFKEDLYEHDYPFCWRCDTPLLYYAKDSWFIKMTALRDELIANNNQINWVPDHIKDGRFGEWLANVKDWAISRERYWGTPLPIWECSGCDHIEVVSSVAKLSALSGEDITLESDIHRPAIDAHQFTCSKCGGSMNRVKEVFDCWFDSGAMPFAQHHYPFENKELIDNGTQYPADFICEAIDQTRGWFYTLLAISTLLDKGSSYKNVVCLGHINDKFGKKMSKSKGNVISPWDVINQYGVDAVRQHMYTINQPGEGKRYDLDDVKDVFRQNIMLLWNVYKFYEMYAVGVAGDVVRPESNNVLDSWILIKLDRLINKIGGELDQYHIYEAAREIPLFIDELSTWYLRRSRDRFKSDDETDKNLALLTTRYVLWQLAKLMSPFMPFMAENLWQKISGFNFSDEDKSVHLENWPLALDAKKDDQQILDQMILVKKAVELGLAKRDEAGIKIRQMLNSVIVKSSVLLDEKYYSLILDELNVKNIEWKVAGEEMGVELDTIITPELKQEGLRRELVRFINMMRKDAGLSLGDKALVYILTDNTEVKAVIQSAKEALLKDILSDDIIEGEGVGLAKIVKIDGFDVKLSLIKK